MRRSRLSRSSTLDEDDGLQAQIGDAQAHFEFLLICGADLVVDDYPTPQQSTSPTEAPIFEFLCGMTVHVQLN